MPLFQPAVTPPSPQDLTGKTAIITGPTAGLGYETCRQLMDFGCQTLVLACRDVSKGFYARESLLSEHSSKSKNKNPLSLKVMQLDLADFSSVRSFASQVQSELPAIDMLILNAGVGFVGEFQRTTDGHETTWQTNYLSNVLLVLDLLPYLQQCAVKNGHPTRISWIGSRTSYRSKLVSKIPQHTPVFDYMDNVKNYSVKDRYADTKMICQVSMYAFTDELVSGDTVTMNMVCPGLINTEFIYRSIPLWAKLLVLLILFLSARTVEQGVWVIVHAVTAGDGSHGSFLMDKDVMGPPPCLDTSDGRRFRQMLWDETMAQMNKIRGVKTE